MKKKIITVLQVISDLQIGGTQEVVKTLTKHLSFEKCNPIVCTFNDGPLRRKIEKLGIKVEILNTRRNKFIKFPLFILDILKTRFKLAELIQKYNVDVVQVHSYPLIALLMLTLFFKRETSILLWTIHNVNFFFYYKKPIRNFYDLLYRIGSIKVSGIITVSDQVKESVIKRIGRVEHKISTIYNGIDVSQFEKHTDRFLIRKELGLQENDLIASTVATLKIQKGHKFLVDAASMIIPKNQNLHFLFIGDGVLRKEIQNQINCLNLNKNIHMLGNRLDIAQLLGGSDFFVLPSLWEGLSIALLEAMASAKPIVATSVSGTKTVMIPNKTGILVEPGNSMKLAKAILKIVQNPQKAKSMGIAAKIRVIEEFSAQKQAKNHIYLYHKLLDNLSSY